MIDENAKRKVVVLLSGGLDSALVVKLMLDQELDTRSADST